MPILSEVARFAGDDIAVVAAVDEDRAQEALDLIKVDYETLPFVLDPEEALKPEAPKIHPKGNLVGGKPVILERGNVEKGFQEADLVYEGRYSTPMLQHVTAEPRVCVARWDRGKLTVWDSLQYTFGPQASLAYIFKIPMSKVRVICDFMGGGFGDKNTDGKIPCAGVDPIAEDRASGEDRVHQGRELPGDPPSLPDGMLPKIRRKEGRNPHRHSGQSNSRYGSLLPP